MSAKRKKNNNIPHINNGVWKVGGYKGGDKKFLGGNSKLLQKLLHNFDKKS